MLSLLMSLLCIVSFVSFDPLHLALYPTDWRWWQFISYAFAHGNTLHLVLNLLALLSFGPPLERAWGRGRFIAAYFACVIVGGLSQVVVGNHLPIVGASAGIIGLFAAYAIAYPRKKVTLLVIDLPAAWLLAGYVGFSLAAIMLHWAQGIGHAAHLGGMVMGALAAFAHKEPRRPDRENSGVAGS